MSTTDRALRHDRHHDRVEVCDVPLVPWTQQEIVAHVGRSVDSGSRTTMFPIYAHCVNVARRDADFMALLQDPRTISYADGMAVVWASRLGSAGVPERCTTTDLFPLIMESASLRGHRVYYLGAAPGVAARCAELMIARFPGLRIVGTRDGFFGAEDADEVIAAVNDASPDIVFVGMGMPYQEKWVAAHRGRLDAAAVLTCGATFDFHSGRVRRAPAWMRRSGLEWAFRLMLEPGRLWRRYLLGNVAFIGSVARARRAHRRRARAGRGRSRGAR